MAERLMEKQRVAVEALEGAQGPGTSLSDYAKAQGLEVRPVHDAIAALRRRSDPWDAMALRYLQLYRELLGEPGNAAAVPDYGQWPIQEAGR